MQSAIAVRRQRSRQEVKKANRRRASSTSVISTPRNSVVSLDGRVYFDQKRENKRAVGHVTMFHVGGVLILIGLMLVTTALMPSYVKSTTQQKRNDLLGIGSFFVFFGGFLTTVSRFVSNNEDKELNQYIKGRLSRSRSGYRLNRDLESISVLPKETKNNKPTHNGSIQPAPEASSTSQTVEPEIHSYKNGHLPEKISTTNQNDNPVISPGMVVVGIENPIPHSASSDPVLSRILEEDEECDASTECLDSSLSMCSSLETQALLEKTNSPRSASKSSIKSSCKSIKIV